MTGTVNRAVNSWCRLFSHCPFSFEPQSLDCAGLMKEVKAFLGRDLPLETEESIMAFRSIKKLLPPACQCLEKGMVEQLMESMLRDPIKLPEGYLAFARKLAGELFPVGWDDTYRSHCLTTAPPLSACAERAVADGGCLEDSPLDQASFLDAVMQGRLGSDRAMAVLGVVQSAGKPRPLASFSSDTIVLKPLHKAIYDCLSRRKWLLRGELTNHRLAEAGFVEGGGSLVSGDYRSATDNLPIVVAEAVLDVAVSNATRVPGAIGDYAKRVLRPFIFQVRYDYLNNTGDCPADHQSNADFQMRASQQMGSLLSFPLLCVQNYIAFRWACFKTRTRSRNIPILINGDDILFQSSESFATSWMETVSEVGLEVERTKTSISQEFGSLNSTLVRWSNGRLKVVPTLRFGMLRQPEFPHNLSKVFRDFVSAAPRKGGVRFIAAREWFSWQRPSFKQGLSLAELGFEGSLAWRAAGREGILTLQKSRLLTGETLDKSLPSVKDLHNVVLSGDNVVKVPSLTKEEELAFGLEVVAWKWTLARNVSISRKTAKLRFFLALHSARFSGHYDASIIACSRGLESRPWYRRRAPEEVDWMVVYKEAYLKPRPAVEKTRFFFNYMDRLPSYEEVDGPVRSAPVHSIRDKQVELALLEARLFGLPDQKDPVHPEGCGSGLSPRTCLCGGPIGDRCPCGGH
jgi:hypothetical protein